MSIESNLAAAPRALRILITDDKANDRKTLRYALDRSGLQCSYVEVSAIDEAIEACQNRSFDCAFVDNMSVSGNGLEGISSLVGKWPFMPVIMVTASGDERIAAEAIQRGAANYFRKSDLAGESVRRAIEEALTMSTLRRSAVEHIKELESFASILAHDLNAPLASLQLYARTLEQDLGSSTEDRSELIALCHEIVDAGVRTAGLVDSLHSYTRPDHGFELTTVDMNAVVEDAKSNLALMISNRRAEITCDELPAVAGNAPFLVELMQNLFANAIKYCDSDLPAVHVTASPGPKNKWYFVVSDNGIGIPADQLELVFEPLKRLHDDNVYQGSGLGLAISRKIVERHGGTIRVRANESGKGSSFGFTLARAEAKELADTAPEVSGESNVEILRGDDVNVAVLRPAADMPSQMFAGKSDTKGSEPDGAGEHTPEVALASILEEFNPESGFDNIPVSGWSEFPAARWREGAPKLLIADDDPGIVRFLVGRCQQMGFEVRSARNGLQALALAKQFQPDVLILDINMPEADGLSVVMRLFLPGNRPMEAIVITASSYEESAMRCESVGAIYIRKGKNMFDAIRSSLLTMFPELDRGEAISRTKAQARAESRMQPRVLVVGDDSVLEKFLSSRLMKYDIETVNVSDGVQGFYRAVSEEPSVVITKYAMPNGDARYLLNKLRGRPETANLPVFVIADEDVDEVVQSRMQHESLNSSGAVRFFTQPINADAFFAELGKYCALAANPNPVESVSYVSSAHG